MDTIQKLATMSVEVYGLGMALNGLISFSEGKSQHNAGAQSEGMSKMLGGGIVFLAGMLAVPAIFGMITF